LGEGGNIATLPSMTHEELQELNNALDRMEKGAYGLCMKCGKQIPGGRPGLVPEAVVSGYSLTDVALIGVLFYSVFYYFVHFR
jgi:hypothetical protein